MSAEEFSNEWDLYWNNISSNQAPGLNEYEKSVFLTKALLDLIQSYFNPKKNKVMEGFELSSKRNMDFSKITLSYITKYNPNLYDFNYDARGLLIELPKDTFLTVNELLYICNKVSRSDDDPDTEGSSYTSDIEELLSNASDDITEEERLQLYKQAIGMLINKNFLTKSHILTLKLIIRISFLDYLTLMSKAYKEPLRQQCWALTAEGSQDNSNTSGTNLRIEVIPRSLDSISIKGQFPTKEAYYVLRYIKKPRPIILTDLSTYYDNVSIDGYNGSEDCYNIDPETGEITTPCELDESMHKEILLRAIEIAKSVYMGDLQSTILGASISGTEMGLAQLSKNSKQE